MRPSPGLWSPQLHGPGREGKDTGSERGEKLGDFGAKEAKKGLEQGQPVRDPQEPSGQNHHPVSWASTRASRKGDHTSECPECG